MASLEKNGDGKFAIYGKLLFWHSPEESGEHGSVQKTGVLVQTSRHVWNNMKN
jgi:hypothetical protein